MTRTTPARPVDIEALFPQLSDYRAIGTRLHPRPGVPSAKQSSVGGPFLWPADEPWPVCVEPHPRDTGLRPQDVRERRRILAEAWSRQPGPDGRRGPTDEEIARLTALEATHHVPGLRNTDPIPLLPLAQLFRHEVPGLEGPAGHDLLQIFWCPFDAHGDGRHDLSVQLYWRNSADVVQVLGNPPEPQVVGYEGYVPEPCVVDPEEVLEHQYAELLPDELREAIDAWDEQQEEEAEEAEEEEWPAYQYDLSIPPGWKVGGFASWNVTGPTQLTCACGRTMKLLVTIDSKEWDNGSRSWVPIEDRAVIDTMDANIPTHITVGRGGSLRIFVCPADPTHPHRINLQ
ncbi:hypothetical protein NGB36_28205 [Streptomyces sp. RB6PN25]|uniref:LigA protein n=1 Tax=Streptomyces humicola TaxID=2953240 RepID=A0ABT1Q357_9ACTN|nr:hypothetical protein [Streptomyces humicola]MCQ4084360.1 hypothetical protein [Streptomyces humicola]